MDTDFEAAIKRFFVGRQTQTRRMAMISKQLRWARAGFDFA